MLCIGLHHHRLAPIEAISAPADLRFFQVATSERGLRKLTSAGDKSHPRAASHPAARPAASEGKSAGTKQPAGETVKTTRTNAAPKIGARHALHAIRERPAAS